MRGSPRLRRRCRRRPGGAPRRPRRHHLHRPRRCCRAPRRHRWPTRHPGRDRAARGRARPRRRILRLARGSTCPLQWDPRFAFVAPDAVAPMLKDGSSGAKPITRPSRYLDQSPACAQCDVAHGAGAAQLANSSDLGAISIILCGSARCSDAMARFSCVRMTGNPAAAAHPAFRPGGG